MEFRNGLKAQAHIEGLDEEYFSRGTRHRSLLHSVAEFDRHEGYKALGFGSTAEVLSDRYCYTLDEARRCVAAAHAIERLPFISRALEDGLLELAQVIDIPGDR